MLSALRFCILAAFLFAPFRAKAGVWEALSAAAYRLHHHACSPLTEKNARQALTSISIGCDVQRNATANLLPIGKAVRDDAEAIYFGMLAKQNALNLTCAHDRIQAMLPKAQAMTDDLNAKLSAIWDLKNQLQQARKMDRRANHNIDLAPVLKKSRAELSLTAHAADAKVHRLVAQMAAIQASIPLSDQPEMKILIEDSLMQHRAVNADLLKIALAALAKRLKLDQARMAEAGRHDGRGLTDNDRYHLSEDERLRAQLEDRAPAADRPALASVACQVNARWGEGQDDLDQDLMLGSMGLSVFAGVGELAMGARMLALASESAAARGIITLSQSRIVMASALGLNSASVYRNIDRACQQGPSESVGRCSSQDPIKSLQADNCYLALALNGLGFALSPGIKMAKARAYWSRLLGSELEHEPEIHVPAHLDPASELGLREQVERNIGRSFSVDEKPIPAISKARMPGHEIRLVDSDGKAVGSFIYYAEPQSEKMMVGKVTVNGSDRKKGVSEYMFSEILAHHPEVRQVDTVLTETNQAIMKKALDAGLNCVEAIKTTPAYKMRAKFGFTVISQEDCEHFDTFVVSRP